MMQPKKIIVIIAVLFSCQQSAQLNNPNIDSSLNKINKSDSVKKVNITKDLAKKSSVDSCHELLLLLIKTSSIDSEIKKLKIDILIDNVVNGIVKIELTTKNEERNENVALSWLELDFNKKELRDITIDPDKPIQLKYEVNLFKKVVANCRLK
jgi:hypothetical protein